ncbi:exo-beta-N-acetylmuramidase NamZ domain-containing protein [Brevibacillus dissolubilis]|uniref:exo-beta-N-acetylmuramidase NamZ domain-containing protein n=1 Tax=Brevibacillus dissolubilis TaxID=1844116 RepID=UPI0034CFE6D5
MTLLVTFAAPSSYATQPVFQLGDDVLLSKYSQVIDGKRIGLITNQTGVNSQGQSMIDTLAHDPGARLTALYGPEHGIDGKALAGTYVPSSIHPTLQIPVYSLYGPTRMPTDQMLTDVDLLLFDIQDIGSRTYTYISTLNYAMIAAKRANKQIVVLDRPNPVGGDIVDGPMLQEGYQTFVGVDILPMAHGMTIGELALYFNRKIGADLTVVPMDGYTRQMRWQDTGLKWIPSSPRIPDLESVFGYMATGLGEGTGIFQADNFRWIGGKGLDARKFAAQLNSAQLPGVTFTPEQRGTAGGARLTITDYHTFNPAKTGVYALAYARMLSGFPVPRSVVGQPLLMFDKIMGTGQIGDALSKKYTPQQIELQYATALQQFRTTREAYLIYGNEPVTATEVIHRTVTIPQPAPVPPVPKPPATPAKPATPTPKPPATPAKPATPTPKPPATPEKPATPTPKPPATPEKPATPTPKPPAKPSAPTGKVAYLTFDDGASNVTPQVLDVLKQYRVRATFFVIGRNAEKYPAMIKRMATEGHVIGGHTYSHDYSKIYYSVDGFFQDLDRGNQAIQKITGQKPTLFRFPGGSNNSVSLKAQNPNVYTKEKWIMPDIVKAAKQRGYLYFDWNVSIGDASSGGYTVESAVTYVKNGIGTKKEIIVLMHDAETKATTAKALPQIIQYLQAQGYRFDVLGPAVTNVAFLR